MTFSFGNRMSSVLSELVETEVSQLERGATQLDRPVLIDGLVGNHRVRIFESGESLFRSLVRDELGACIFERLAAGDVIEVVVAVNHVPDRLVRDLLDLFYIGRHRLGAAVADRVGRDHAGRRDDKHCLAVPVTEDVDVIGAFDLGGCERRWLVLRLDVCSPNR
jgi:hypothetical protein